MKIKRIELKNFRCFNHLVLENLPDVMVLASRNGQGKSSILDAIVAAKELTKPYHTDKWDDLEHTDRQTYLNWPNHMRPPLKRNTTSGLVKITFQPSSHECDRLNIPDIKSGFDVSLELHGSNRIKSEKLSDGPKKILGYNPPGSGIGYLDYISSIRHYPKTTINNINEALSGSQSKRSMSDISQESHQYYAVKWGGIKPYIFTRIASDASRRQHTGEDTDSLKQFRDAFNLMFHPKTFVGIDDINGSADVFVDTPHSRIEIDSLSDGEKEILNILCHLHRYRESENIILWDTPESHLNAILEKRLIHTLKTVSPKSQFIIATHSPEIIESVETDSIYIIEESTDGAKCVPIKGTSRGSKSSLYRQLGASVAIQIAAKKIVFVEGKNKNSDKSMLEAIFSQSLSGCIFVAAQDCSNVISSQQRSLELLREIESESNIMAIIDRDYVDTGQIQEMQLKNTNLFIWPVHELENVFLDSSIIRETLSTLGLTQSEDEIESKLKESAYKIHEWIAADWTAWEIENQIKSPSRRINSESSLQDLKSYQERWKQAFDSILDESSVEDRYETHKREIISYIEDNTFIQRLPGKQLLSTFLTSINFNFKKETFLSVSSNLIARGIIKPKPIAELEAFLQQPFK